MKKAVFLDKDGTLIKDIPYNVDPQKVVLTPHAAEGLRILARLGYLLIVVSNQAGVAKGCFDEHALQPVRRRLDQLFAIEQVNLHGFYYCPHHPDGSVPRYAVACQCRKPSPGMLLRAADEHGINLFASWMIGDILNDIEAGNAAGCRTILIDNGNETEWRISAERTPDFIAADIAVAARVIAQQDALQAYAPTQNWLC